MVRGLTGRETEARDLVVRDVSLPLGAMADFLSGLSFFEFLADVDFFSFSLDLKTVFFFLSFLEALASFLVFFAIKFFRMSS